MQSNALAVDQYMKEVPPEREEALAKLRGLCLAVPEVEEGMQYGMPTYGKDDNLVFAWASQKQYISLYFPPPILRKWEERVAGPGVTNGKSCLRFSRAERINFDQVEQMLKESFDPDAAHP